jgi:monovalent cation/hydrogen antiporter
MIAIVVDLVAIVALVAIASRINVAYPIVLVLGGMIVGFVPGVPTLVISPDVIFLAFLPPLLFWESITAPISDMRAGAWWIFQMAFGLVIATTVSVALVAHAVVPGMQWNVAFVLGAVVSSTDEVAFYSLADRLPIPSDLIGTIEGESLINDAMSLVLYGSAVASTIGGTFNSGLVVGKLVLSILEALVIGLAAGMLALIPLRKLRDPTVQGTIMITIPFISYLAAYYCGASGVLAVITTGLFLSRYTFRVLQPRGRQQAVGFWTTLVFLLNAFIFVSAGLDFH